VAVDDRAVSVTPVEAESLRGWVERERATRTIEIGLGYGVSALAICEGLHENGRDGARHVVVDPFQETRFEGRGWRALEEAGFGPLVELHPEESQLVLPRLVSEGRRFDLAFVDGNHRFDGVFLDLVYLGRLVRGGGIVFLDDYQLPTVARAVSFCTSNLGWTVEEVSPPDELHQWAVARIPATPPERRFDHFVDF
jgi:predicted O-methyltransferase YrrM